jgi:hypothetical protein
MADPAFRQKLQEQREMIKKLYERQKAGEKLTD